MADATQNASPAPAVATESRSESPKNTVQSPGKSATPPIKMEKSDESAGKVNGGSSQPTSSDANPAGGTPTPAATTPAPIKIEPTGSSTPAAPATPANKPLTISIPPTTDDTALDQSANAAAAPSTGAPAPPFSTVAHIFSNSVDTPAISPLSDVGPATKRSRTPEPEEEENSGEKRQKLEHTDSLDQGMLDVGAPIENEPGDSSMVDWDLEAQLQNILDSVPAADDEANGAGESGKADPEPFTLPPPRPRLEKMKYIENPTYFARAMGLPLLGSLSVQILLALFQQPSEVTDRQIRDVRTEGGKVYTQLRSTFMALLKLFIDAPTFLNADDLDINEPGDRETIQMANLASMCASFYGPGGPTMATAHDNFLKIMIPENGIITQEIAALYLDQKTQSFLAYANVMEDKEATRNSLLEKFFPGDLEDKLRAYWKDSTLVDFIPSDEFVNPFTERRKLLKAIGHDKEQRKALEAKYQFASFLDSLSAFIRSNFDSILDYAESHGIEVPNEAGEEDLMLMHAQSTYAGSYPGQPRRNGEFDTDGLAMLISEKFAGEDGYSYGYGVASAIPESKILPPSQSLPTSVLYERARQAAVAKSSAGARREGLQSTRRPWTPEEEKALMAGLDMVKGPHWSQILQLFGPNGTIKDILKDRTQVQLKDKARNLKLFFLKTNSEMPYYLQCVTGELKTRAPNQAAKKEAEEQTRVHTGGHPNGYAYMNGPTNGSGPVSHGMPMGASPRPGTTPPVANSGVNASHQPIQQYQQPHQQYHPQQQQQQQSYQQPRTQQLQPAPNGAARSPAPGGHHPPPPVAKPPTPHSSHQPIAPAPSYQRPLQQAGAAPGPQYQHRPAQHPTGQPPASYQQANRPVAPSPSNALPPRPNYSTTTPQVQSRPPVPSGQGTPAPPRPISAASTAPPRPSSTQAPSTASPRPAPTPAATSTPSPAPGQASRGGSTNNILAPRSQTPASSAGASAPPRPVHQPSVPTAGPHAPTQPVQQPSTTAATVPTPARPTQQPIAQPPTQPPVQPPQSAPQPAPQPTVAKQTPIAPTPTSAAPVSAAPQSDATTPAAAPAVSTNAPDRVEANIEMLAQKMREENA